jgi:AcrR family transcriptional regulator
MAAIAAEAGLDRRTVYRRFAGREVLRDGVLQAKLDAFDAVLDDARLDSAPVAVALHRLVEGLIVVARRYPIDLLARQFRDHDPAHAADIATDTLLRGVGQTDQENRPQLIAA